MNLDYLPDDILHLICEQIRLLPESSATLYNCAVSGKRLAAIALPNLYRHARSPGSYDELDSGSIPETDQTVMRWAIMWRSVFLACSDKTLYPYASYLRFADLRDLAGLIEHPRFQKQIENFFFQGDLASLKQQNQRGRFTNPVPIVERIGDAIFSQNSLIEVLSGNFSAGALDRWISNLPRLRRLELYNGDVLSQQTQETVCQHCPYFKDLSIYSWSDRKADSGLAPFFQLLPSDSLSELTNIGSCGFSSQAALTLNCQASSLTNLHLVLEPDAVGALGEMTECTSLRTLYLHFSSPVYSYTHQPETFSRFSSWLGECKDLKNLTLVNLESAAAATTPMLLNNQIRLEDLTITSRYGPFFTEDSPAFNYALAHQQSLIALELRGDGEDAVLDQIDNFIECVTQLVRLKRLELRDLMENFRDDDIVRLLLNLSQLEEIFIGGEMVTDRTLNCMGPALSNLKRWTVMAPSRFSADALLRIIERLDERGNDRLQLSVDMADPSFLLTAEEQAAVRSALKAKVGGTFDYIPLREPDASDSEDYSD